MLNKKVKQPDDIEVRLNEVTDLTFLIGVPVESILNDGGNQS